MKFLVRITEGLKPSTRKLKYSLLKSLFNFVKILYSPIFPIHVTCCAGQLSGLVKYCPGKFWDAVDEFISKTNNPGNSFMLDLVARGGMRIGEVLKLNPRDVQGRKLHLPNPKSGRTSETVFIPQIFRVFQNKHPGVHLTVTNAKTDVIAVLKILFRFNV